MHKHTNKTIKYDDEKEIHEHEYTTDTRTRTHKYTTQRRTQQNAKRGVLNRVSETTNN